MTRRFSPSSVKHCARRRERCGTPRDHATPASSQGTIYSAPRYGINLPILTTYYAKKHMQSRVPRARGSAGYVTCLICNTYAFLADNTEGNSIVAKHARFRKALNTLYSSAVFLESPSYCWLQAEQRRSRTLPLPIRIHRPGVKFARNHHREWFGSPKAHF